MNNHIKHNIKFAVIHSHVPACRQNTASDLLTLPLVHL